MYYRSIEEIIIRLIKAVSLFVFVTFPIKAEELDLTAAEAKAYYTIEITKQINWPDESGFDRFIIGIIGTDPELYKAFDKYKTVKVKGKGFAFKRVDIEDQPPEHFSIIFTTAKARSQSNQIFKQFTKSLIITDGRVSKKDQMISFITSGRQMKMGLNRENLLDRGFEISANLLVFAGTKEDLSEQLMEKESHLKELRNQEQGKEKNIEQLNNVIEEKTAQLASAQNELKRNKQTLRKNGLELISLKENLKHSQVKMGKVEVDIKMQELLLKQKQDEMALKQKEIAKLQSSIDENLNVLQEQVLEIEKQNTMMENKDQTIETQRGWMYVILLVTIIFFVMIYILLKTNRLRKQANSKLSQLNSQLFELATTDSMTGLFNRRHFLESSQNELLRQKRNQYHSALLMIDIDHFKKVNDSYGHAAGDAVIKSVADHLKAHMRNYDLIGRFGGEEYVMMLVDCDSEFAFEIAQRLCTQVFEQIIYFEGQDVNISISIGLSQLNEQDLKIEQTIVRADKALYKAKKLGRNQVVRFT